MNTSFKILIVEDEVIIAQDLKETLEAVGYKSVYRANSYATAIETIHQKRIDLVMLDINLNHKYSGLDLADYINKNHEIPFIYLTSYYDSETIIKVKHTKPTGFLLKPFNEALLLATIEVALFNFYSNVEEAEKRVELKILEEGDYEFFVGKNLILKEKKYYIKIPILDVLWFESDKNYIDIITLNKKYTLRSSLKKLIEKLPDSFIKCHRQYVVNLNHVTGFNSNFIAVGDFKIPLSRNNRELVRKRLNM
jgi:two-component system response regulator LytT